MAYVRVTNVTVLDNPSLFTNPFQFEITFDCLAPLTDDLEWKIVYVGSADSDEHDQVLDSILVGPVPVGVNKFVFQADPPDVSKIPSKDSVGVTVLLLTCSYYGQEFVRIGYFVNNEYLDEEYKETPPTPPRYDRLMRNILHDKPRVTTFQLNWESPTQPFPMPQMPVEGSDMLGEAAAAGDAMEEDDEDIEEEEEEEDEEEDDAADAEMDVEIAPSN